MADTERPLREQMEHAQARAIAKTFVDLNEIHRSATTAGDAPRLDPALLLCEAIGVSLAQL